MIQFINVTVKHSDSRGIKNLSFQINKGQFIYLMGPNGQYLDHFTPNTPPKAIAMRIKSAISEN